MDSFHTSAQKTTPCQLIVDGEFNNYVKYTGTTEPICNFQLDKSFANTPDRFIGSAQNGTPSSGVSPSNFCSTSTQSPNILSYDKAPNNIFFGMVTKFNGIIANNDPGKSSEGITLPLTCPTVPKSVYDFHIRVASGCKRTLYVLFSDNPPCPKSSNNPIGYNQASINCNGASPFNVGEFWTIDVPANPNWDVFNINQTLNGKYNHITIYSSHEDGLMPPFNQNNAPSRFFIDDVKLEDQSNDKITWTTDVVQGCIGGELEIDYSVCVQDECNPNEITITPNIPSGMTLSPKCTDFPNGKATFTLPNGKNKCKDLKLILDVDKIFKITANLDIVCDLASPFLCSATKQTIVTPVTIYSEDSDFAMNTIPCPSLNLTPLSDISGSTHDWTITDVKGNVVSTNANNTKLPQGNYTVMHVYTYPCGTGTGKTMTTKIVTIKCDTCECSSGIVVNDINLSQTDFYQQNSNSLDNTCITVNGTLTIDEDFTFSNVDFIMATDSKIYVNKGIKLSILEESHLYACVEMWKGIELAPSSKLTFQDNTIEDAFNAITLSDKVFLNIKRNTFRANRVNIYFPPSGSNTMRSVLPSNNYITGNTFTCQGVTLKEPYGGDISLAGIDVNNCTNFTIGLYSTLSGTNNPATNRFLGLTDAILAKNCTQLKVNSAIITNMVQNGITISNNSDLKLRNATITNAIYGVFAKKSTLNISSSVNISQVIRGIITEDPINTFIDDCTVQANKIGIFVNGNMLGTTTVPNIQNSTINLTTNTEPDGIKLLNINALGAPDFFSIHDVTVNHTANSSPNSSSRGLRNLGTTKIKCENNYFNGSANSRFGGILLSGNNYNHFKHNNMSLAVNSASEGFLFMENQNIRICCSEINNASSGFFITGSNPDTKLRNNKLMGLFNSTPFSVSQTSKYGIQINGRNQWINTSSNSNIKLAFHYGGQNPALYQPYIDDSRMQINDTDKTSAFWAQGSIFPVPTGNTAKDWFVPSIEDSYKCETDFECLSPAFKPSGKNVFNTGNPFDAELTISDTSSAKGAFHSAAYGAMTSSKDARYLYKKLSEYPNLMQSNKLMESFYAQTSKTNIAKLYAIEKSINELTALSDDEKNALISESNTIESLQETLDIYSDAYDKTTDEKEQAELLGFMSEYQAKQNLEAERYSVTMDEIRAKRLEMVAAMKEDNTNIDAQLIWEKNEKIVNQIYLETVLSNVHQMTAAQAKLLAPVAYQCENEGGRPVTLARALYKLWIDKNFKIEEYCRDIYATTTTKVKAEDRSSTYTIENNHNISIYPNPTTGLLNVEIISIEANPKLVITDLSGKIKSTFHIIQNQDSYDLNQLENGIYICIISNDKGIITTKKLVILK